MIPLLAAVTDNVTWIKVESPRLDLVGLILGSLGLAGAIAALALVLGCVLGVAIILRRRRVPAAGSTWIADGTLHLDLAPHSSGSKLAL